MTDPYERSRGILLTLSRIIHINTLSSLCVMDGVMSCTTDPGRSPALARIAAMRNRRG
jgi:hypothetical protein